NNLATRAMKPGPSTTDYYSQLQKTKQRLAPQGLAVDTLFSATPYPIFPLATTDGGAVVLYSLSHNIVTYVKKPGGRLPAAPRDVAPLLDTLVLKDQLQVFETLTFAAV